MHETYQLTPAPAQVIAPDAVRQRAEAVDHRIEEIVHSAKSEFIECGFLLREMEDDGLWAYLSNPETGEPYSSLPEWANYRLSYGRATYMEAKRVVREFAHLPVETLSEIPRCNFKHLRLLPESKQTPEWIEAAKGPEKEFVEKVIRDLPDLHVEKRIKLVFSLDESSEKEILEAIELKLKELHPAEPEATKEDALLAICIDWKQEL